MDLLEEIKSISKNILGDNFSHGFPHVIRVRRWAWLIVREERLDIDPFVLDAAVYLHDVGRVLGEPHAYYSMLFAKAFLLEHGVPVDKVELVCNAILYHSFSYASRNKVEPLSEEAKVLSDADKLDALGVIGFLRVFEYSWMHNRSIEETLDHFRVKILRLGDLMHYNYSRRVAGELTNRVRLLVDMFTGELEKKSC